MKNVYILMLLLMTKSKVKVLYSFLLFMICSCLHFKIIYIDTPYKDDEWYRLRVNTLHYFQ
jgi:hypothetical protein